MLSPEDIENLVNKAQSGSEKSFSKLFDHFFPKVFRHVSFRVSDENTEDITSDIFLKIVQHLGKYVPQRNAGFSAWIFRIVHNAIIDHYRKKKELLGIDNEEKDFFAEIPDEEDLHPDNLANRDFDIRKMHVLLRELPAIQRTILELKYLEEFSNAEISYVTGKSEGNVRIIQLRALRKMRKEWKK